MENKARQAAEEIVLRMDSEGIIDLDDGDLQTGKMVHWIKTIIANTYNEPEEVIDQSFDDSEFELPAILEFGEGDGTSERLQDEW